MNIWSVANKKELALLRSKMPEVDLVRTDKKELKELIAIMRKMMKEANGIGLSANQIGVKKKMFVAQVPDGEGRPKFYAIINPKLIKFSLTKTSIEEGCLSVPLKYGPVERPEKVVLEGYAVDGKKIKIKAWGLLARVFQHEVDHLEGKLFIDKASHLHSREAGV